MTEQEQREVIVAEARSWVGTPFVHGQGLKGCGVDCAHLPDSVFVACNLAKKTNFPIYHPDWFLHADHEDKWIVEGMIAAGLHEITEDKVGIGDIMIIKIGRAYAHCTIITEMQNGKPYRGVNAWPIQSKVWEVDIQQDAIFAGRKRKYFSPWGE